MIFSPTQTIYDYLIDHNIKCRIIETEKYSMVQVSYNGESFSSLDIRFFSSDDENDISVRTSAIARVPADRLSAIRELINECNRRYRFIKLIIDDERDIMAEYDMLLSSSTDSLGEGAREVCSRFVNIVDKIYPELMRTMYAEFVLES